MDDQKYTFGKTFETDYWVDENGTYKGDSYTRGTYTPSDTVNAAYEALQSQMANKPSAYVSQWQNQINDTINKITNRDKFSYDVNGDALYQQYKDKYIQQGKMAMQDTMGQAAAMTGGYGNSYAATAGNQAYQAHLNNLNDVVPELYQMAYNRYQDEGQELYNQYSLFADRDNTEYGRYRDTVSDWQTDRSFLANRYDTERNFDYGAYSDKETANQAQWNADRTFAYGQYTDDLTLDYEESKRLHNEKLAKDSAAAAAAAAGQGNDTPLLTDLDKITGWVEQIRAAKTEDEALMYLGILENLDPSLADSLYKEWMTAHGLDIDKIDTTVTATNKKATYYGGSGGGGGRNKEIHVKQ